MKIITQTSHRLNMVCMIMSDKDMMNILKLHAIIMKMLFQASQSDTNIYQYRIRLSVKIVAITTTSTAEGNKSQHLKLYFHAKLAKKTHITKFFSTFVAIFSKLIRFKHQFYGKKCNYIHKKTLISHTSHHGMRKFIRFFVTHELPAT